MMNFTEYYFDYIGGRILVKQLIEDIFHRNGIAAPNKLFRDKIQVMDELNCNRKKNDRITHSKGGRRKGQREGDSAYRWSNKRPAITVNKVQLRYYLCYGT